MKQPKTLMPWMLIANAILMAGCATVGKPLADLPEDVAATRTDREENAVGQFERTRDNALYQTALARWRDGDAAACESMLVRLLQLNDEHREARLMLADLYASTGKPKAAAQHLRLLIERNSDDAQAHHSLGMLLATTGTPNEALDHLQKAAALEPENELYSLSYDDAKADLHTSDDGEPNSQKKKPEETPYFCEIDG